jgi:Recombination endonuclease VII
MERERMSNTPDWFDPATVIPCEHEPKYGWELCRSCYDKARLRSMPIDQKREDHWRNSLRKYDLTPEQWQAMSDAQGGVCAICKEPNGTGKRDWRLHIDHDHETGEVRALLCTRCNLAVGHLRESTKIAEAMLLYITSHKGSWYDRFYRLGMLALMVTELLLIGWIAWRS